MRIKESINRLVTSVAILGGAGGSFGFVCMKYHIDCQVGTSPLLSDCGAAETLMVCRFPVEVDPLESGLATVNPPMMIDYPCKSIPTGKTFKADCDSTLYPYPEYLRLTQGTCHVTQIGCCYLKKSDLDNALDAVITFVRPKVSLDECSRGPAEEPDPG